MSPFVEVTRGGLVESRHRVHAAVVDRDGTLRGSLGDPEMVGFMRSAAKPFQALPLVEDGVADALGITPRELALCCGSHNAEDAHLKGARSVLARAGLDEEDLGCGPHPPLRRARYEELLRAGVELSSIHNNCSGKHAGMLALAVHHGWPVRGYLEADHPVQARMLEEVVSWTGVPEESIGRGVDGCGVVSFALPLRAMARGFASFAAAARTDDGPRRIVEAMTTHPFEVAGTGRVCTAVMERAGERVFVKTGAEGVYCAGLRDRAWGVALKVEDGGRRASGVALIRVLHGLGILDGDDVEALGDLAEPGVKNTRGEDVGALRATFTLEAS